MSDPFLGEIKMVGFGYPPQHWAQCDGQLLAINQYMALYSLLGTHFGGNGQTTFGIPDLRGRVPLHYGQGPAGDLYYVGNNGGAEDVTLNLSQLPAHSHALMASNDTATKVPPATTNYLATPAVNAYAAPANPATLNPAALSSTGGGQAHNNIQPSLVLNFCIAMTGMYPSRN